MGKFEMSKAKTISLVVGGFVAGALISLHIDTLRGRNAHHIAETVFKGFGRALRMAVEFDPRMTDIPSTKGSL